MILLALLEVQRAARVVLVPGSSQVLLQLHECPSRLLGLSLGLRNVRPASVSSPPSDECDPAYPHLFIVDPSVLRWLSMKSL